MYVYPWVDGTEWNSVEQLLELQQQQRLKKGQQRRRSWNRRRKISQGMFQVFQMFHKLEKILFKGNKNEASQKLDYFFS